MYAITRVRFAESGAFHSKVSAEPRVTVNAPARGHKGVSPLPASVNGAYEPPEARSVIGAPGAEAG